MKKLALVYGFGSEEEAVCKVLTDAKLTCRVVKPQELDETIGYLCGFSGFAPGTVQEETPLKQAFVLFGGISQKELNGVLAAIKQAGIQTASLKAMITDTNSRWTMRKLAEELQTEHRTMGALMDLKRYRDSLPAPTVLNLPLMTAMMQADFLLSGTQEVTLEQIFQAKKALMDAQKQ